MPQENYTPYILSVFSNPPDNKPGYLRYLDMEKGKLDSIFSEGQKKYPLIPIPLVDKKEDNLDSKSIADAIKDFKKMLTIFHYSGHADYVLLSLNEEDLRAQNFARHIRDCENIKLVVLNGCSTKGFVRLLLETTSVKAVIATNNPVKDDRAMVFSTEFYEGLVEKATVANAFTYALSRALKGEYEKDSYIFKTNLTDNKIVSVDLLEDNPEAGVRGVKKNKQPVLDEDAQIADWGIYARVGDVLDWNIYESSTESEKILKKMDEEIRKIEVALTKAESDVLDLEEIIESFEAKTNPTARQVEVKEKQKVEMADLQEKIQKYKLNIDSLNAEKTQIGEEVNLSQRIRFFSEVVPKLNYTIQLDKVSSLIDENLLDKYSCFILHGDTKSCLHLLSHRVRGRIGFRNERKITFDFDSFHMDDFWNKLQHEILGQVVSYEPEKIVQEVVRNYRDEKGKSKNNFLLVFRNKKTDAASAQTFNHMVFSFWKEFITHFRKFDTEKPYTHRIYAFIIDDSCEVIRCEDSYKGSRENDYIKLYDNDDAVKPTFQLLPVAGHVTATEISKWQNENELQEDYKYNLQELNAIIDQTQGIFLDTVEKLCNKGIENEFSKQKIFTSIKTSINQPI